MGLLLFLGYDNRCFEGRRRGKSGGGADNRRDTDDWRRARGLGGLLAGQTGIPRGDIDGGIDIHDVRDILNDGCGVAVSFLHWGGCG